ncbi:MAG: HU family DNA-binding protein [Alphaproteobacteria bacterium]
MAKKAMVKKGAAKKAAAPKVAPKRFIATPTGTSDRLHLISVIQKETNCTAKVATETFNSLIGTITASLKKNQKVQLTGFGSFTVTKRSARKGRNPATGEAIKIKASKVVRFKSGQTMKNSV